VLVRRLLLASVAVTLLLTGCGTDEDAGSKLSAVEVTDGASPKLAVDKDFTATKTTSRVVKDGSGDKLASGESVKVNYVAVNGRTGKQFDNSFTSSKPLTITLDEKTVLPGFVKGLTGKKVGSRVLVAISPKDGFGQAQANLDIKADDTMVFLFDVVSKIPQVAAGKAVAAPKDLPKLELDGSDKPAKFAATGDTAKKKSSMSAHTVIQGDGATLEKGQTLTAQYVGQVYPSGKVFDSSWTRGAPASFQIGAGVLIKCWDEQLVGQKLGSRVLLVCPSDKAYGDEGSPPDIRGGDTLIFAIDLLDAS
jgi:FKBP-type peptidyl-prolyl cis-trans isomerase